MSTEPTMNCCPRCGEPIPAEAAQGLCPKCLLAAASTPTESGQTRADRPAPSLEILQAAFPQLEILELIGAGGMGAVYKARQPKLERIVALKILPQHLARDPAFAERFTREARLLARLNHSNIVTVYDFGHSGDFYFLLMEFVDGVNLRQAMQAGRFTPQQALLIVPKICEALQFAHDEGILHRDIKPENILLDAKGRIKIADFGIAKLLGDKVQGLGLTASGVAVGTPNYMAPEQLERPQDVDQRADIYSLGVVFYEMLTGELPIGRFAPPSQKVATDPRVDEVVLRALEKEREKRYRTAAEVKTGVEALQTPSPAGAANNPPSAQGAADKTQVVGSLWRWAKGLPVRPVRRHEPTPHGRFRTPALAVAALVGVILMIWLGATWWQGRQVRSALEEAARGDLRPALNLLGRGIDLNTRSPGGETLLIWAAIHNDPGVAELLLKQGANVNAMDREQQTALIWAAASGADVLVEQLLQRGAYINHKASNGTTALMSAAWNGSVLAAKRLLQAGASVDEKDAEQQTALMKAAFQGHTAIVEALLSHDAKVNEVNALGQSSLMLAAFNGHGPVVEVLLQHEPPLETRDGNGQTAVMLALAGGHEEVVNLLIAHGATEPGSLYLARGYQAALAGRATNAVELLNRALEKAGEPSRESAWNFRIKNWSYSVPNPDFVLRVLLTQCARDVRDWKKAREYAAQVESRWPGPVNLAVLYRRSLVMPDGEPRQVTEQYSTSMGSVRLASVSNGKGTVLLERQDASPGRREESSRTLEGLIH